MRLFRAILFVTITGILSSAMASGDPIKLFEKNQPVEKFNELIGDLRTHFSKANSKPILLLFDENPKEILIDGYLGEGTQAIIFSSGKFALRLPLNKMRAENSTDNYYNAWKVLQKGKYSSEFIPKVFHYQKKEYVLVSRENIVTDYGKFIDKYDHCRANPEIEISLVTQECNYCEMLEMNEKLLQLVHDLSEFDQIGDAHKHNVVYIKDENEVLRWMVLDFSPDVVPFSSLPERKRLRRLGRFDAFQYNYETVDRSGKNPMLYLQDTIDKVVEHARTDSTCSGKHDSFAQFDPLFDRLNLLCKSWNTLYKQ